MTTQATFTEQYPLTLELWSQCVDEQQRTYEQSQQAVRHAFKQASLYRFGSPEYNAAWNHYVYTVDARKIERETLNAISNYYR